MTGEDGQEPARTIATELDGDYYRATYRDVDEEPVAHFVRIGWREGRKPAAWFDTAFYLAANPDVRDAGVNPFWHFLAVGRAEGRAARRAGGHRREVIEALATPGAPPAPEDGPSEVLLATYLTARLREGGPAGLVVRVLAAAGDAEFLAEEARRLEALGRLVVDLTPCDASGLVEVALDGAAPVAAGCEDVVAAIVAAGRPGVLVVHSLSGHDLAGLEAIAAALGGGRGILWLDDFSALCPPGRLMRNEIEFCGAPAEDSNACHVCIHGPARRLHLAGVRLLLAAGRFTVVAPSAAAASLWLRVSPFPPMPVVSAEPWRLEARRRRVWRGSMEAPVRVMVGGAPVGEGAAVIAALMERVGRLADYRFVAADAHQAGAGWADLVLVLPGGPEPFSRAALAALATGAELVTLRDRLHAAELAHAGRGVVLADAAALFAFFENLDAVAHVRARRAATSEAGAMRVGTTTAEVLS